MESLWYKSQQMSQTIDCTFKRYLYDEVDWKERLVIIKGTRGSGKTTMMLQQIKENIKEDVLFLSLDDIFFSQTRLADVADDFIKRGGKFLFIDEAHKYPQWSREIKNIYDTYKEIKVVVSGSSILEINKGEADLSRRSVKYELHELSLREYLSLVHKINFPVYSLENILWHHVDISAEINKKIKPIRFFNEFIEFGAYPFIVESKRNYHNKIQSIINLIIENDIPSSVSINYETLFKLKKLLLLISESVPFKPNISELSHKINTSRDQAMKHLTLLQNSRMISLLTSHNSPSGYLTKPEKIYLNNTSLMFALNEQRPETGALRETFFMHQLAQKHKVAYTGKGDFLIDGKYTFEIGGKDKSGHQIRGLKNSYIAADNIEFGIKNRIPLWIFGFLY